MQQWGVLVILSMAVFIIVIDTTIMNVSITALVDDLSTTVSGIQAAIALYALVMASFILMGGKLADILGKRHVFLAGLVIFGVGTSIASLASSLAVLVVGWSLIEGIGSALMMPNIQTILRGEYEGENRAYAYGMISAVAAIGAAAGPILGGMLTTYASWRWAFRLEVAIVLIVLALSGRIARDVPADPRPGFDIVGALLSIAGWSTIVLGVLLGQPYGYFFAKQPLTIGAFEIAPLGLSVVPFLIGIGVLLIVLLVRWEQRLEQSEGDGLFRPSLFQIVGLTPAFGVRFAHLAVSAAFLFLAPLMLQLTFGYSAMQTGLALIPYSLALLVAALLGARLSSRFTAKRIIQSGFVVGIAGLVAIIATVQPGVSPGELASGALFGAGMGLVASQILNLVLSSGTEEDTAEIAGLNGTFEQLGNSFGVALVGSMVLVVLTVGVQQSIAESERVPEAYKVQLTAAVENSIELASDDQLTASLDAAGLEDALRAELVEGYAIERTRAFRAGIAFLVFVALAGLIVSSGLSNRMLA